MTYIKNKSGAELNLSILGIVLAIDEFRDIAEFTTRDELERKATVMIELLNDGSISLLDSDMNEFQLTDAIKYCLNTFHVVTIKEGAEPLLVKANENESKFYFVRDKEMKLNKNTVYTRTFLGDLQTLQIFAKHAEIEITIKMNGLVFPTETVRKNQTYEFGFESKAIDFSVEISTTKHSKEIEIYMDGKSDDTTTEIQNFIDNWSL